jgi:hypothetical protein
MARVSLNSIGYDEIVGLDAFDTSAIGSDDDEDSDEVGYDEIVGADNDVADFLGIGGPGRKNMSPRNRALAALQRGKRSININPQKARFLQIGGSATQGASAGPLDITIKVQEPIRPQRLVLGAYDANGAVSLSRITLSDIKVGSISQMANNGNLPANMFSEQSTMGMAGFTWDTVQSGTDLVLRFSSVPASTTVTAGISGMALR